MNTQILAANEGPFTGTLLPAGPPSLIAFCADRAEPILSFHIEDGRLDAVYDPDRITEAAQALITEVKRLQGVSA